MSVLVWLFLGLYTLFIGWMLWYSHKIPLLKVDETLHNKSKFSLVIPFKNEADNLPRLLASLNKIDYPNDHFEIIMVDDHSSDASSKIVKSESNITLLTNKGKGKKSALLTGILQSQYRWIITTDADTELPEGYLKTANRYTQKFPAKMYLGPVRYFDQDNFINQFQQFEFLSLQALTMAGVEFGKPFLANGANLIFAKAAFFEVNAYQGNEQIASGDDVFLLEKFKETFVESIVFMKDQSAIVQTKPPQTWYDLLQQKIRWASKTKYQKAILPILFGLLTLISNLLLVISFLTPYKYGFFIIGKFMLDSLLLWQINKFYKAKIHWWYLPIAFLIYPFYFILIGVLAMNGTYKWK
jgi:biofilm PGA synthesis N-glycosyltransferase PgaC